MVYTLVFQVCEYATFHGNMETDGRETEWHADDGRCCSTDARGGNKHLRRERIDNMCSNPNPLGQRLLKDYNQTFRAWIPRFGKATLGGG